jgi:hypothetical protein
MGGLTTMELALLLIGPLLFLLALVAAWAEDRHPAARTPPPS